MSEFRIKSATGRWASGQIKQRPWISEDMLDQWRRAAGKAGAAGSGALGEAIDLAEKMGFCNGTEEVVMPMGPAEMALADEQEAIKRSEFIKGSSHQRWGSRQTAEDWTRNRDWHRSRIDYEVSIKRQVRFVAAPSVEWGTVPGDARMVELTQARVAILNAGWAIELRRILPKARALCRRLGAEEEASWAQPLFDKHGLGTRELAEAVISEFKAAEEFEDKHAIAIYVGGTGKGFVDKRGEVKNDIAEACLFPNEAKAAAFALRYVGSCFAVDVVVSAVGYKPLRGMDASALDLDMVIASREKREIEQVLARVQVEQLEEELSKRRLEAGESSFEPKAKSKSRL